MALTRSNIATAGALEPQRQNCFELILLPPSSGTVIQFWLQSFPFPGGSIGVGTTNYFNDTRKWASGPAVFPEKAVVLNEYVDARSSKVMWDWWSKAYDPKTGKIGLTSDYKSDGTLNLYGPDGSSSLQKWAAHGVWVSGYEGGSGDMASGDQVKITATLQIDYWTLEG